MPHNSWQSRIQGLLRQSTSHALQLLRLATAIPNATFREKQEDAIRHVVEGGGRLLVVQKRLFVSMALFPGLNRLERTIFCN